jgi:IS1 family transposase
MYRLDAELRAKAVAALVEGNSIRAVARMTGIARNTITGLLVDLGTACAEYQDTALRNLPCKRIQCDEIWAFCYAKDKNVPTEKQGQFGFGSVWTWTAIDADTKIVCSWMVGSRDTESAHEFMQDLVGRLANRVQLTTDGHHPYLEAVDYAFGGDVDYAMLVKIYGGSEEAEKRYSPAKFVAAEKRTITGNPKRKHISTSFVERQNLTMRMSMRRFTRLTNGFSKKVENHIAAVSLHFMYYNFVRIHQTLRETPAMAAGVTDRLWEISDIVRLLEDWQERQERAAAMERAARLLGVPVSSLPKKGRIC